MSATPVPPIAPKIAPWSTYGRLWPWLKPYAPRLALVLLAIYRHRTTGLPASALQLELSESALMREAQFSSQILQQLHSLGVLLAVDEFGTGYSSLTQLAQFPLDVLKIDQSFVQKLDAQDDNRVIVSALIAMGSSLKLRLVAEGVENPAQLAFLKGQRCEEGQGFLFSPPLAAERMSALLVRGIRPLTFSGRE